MSSQSSRATHAYNVAVVFLLGVVYVCLLTVGTLLAAARRLLRSTAAGPRNVIGRLRGETRSAESQH